MSDKLVRRLLPILPRLGVCMAAALLACNVFGQSSSSCRIAQASRLPAYALQGTWTPDGSRLVLVDPVYEQVHVYDGDSGRYRGILKPPAAIDEKAFFPVSARTLENHLVVESFPQRLLVLGERHELTDIREPLRELQEASRQDRVDSVQRKGAVPHSGNGTVRSMFMWSFVGKDIVACGDIQKPDGSWSTGFVRFGADAPEGFKAHAVSDFDNPEWIFCRLGFPYIADIGDRAYVLIMNEAPGIYEIGPNGEFKRLAYKLRTPGPVRLPEFTTESEFVTTMKEVEQVTMPVGLYAWENRLFVQYRRAETDADGERWILDEVNPTSGRLVSQATIDSSASHLLLIPGRSWALIEKGSVLQFGDQPTQQIRLLRSESLNPLRGTLCATH